ncbi:MAG: gliding motility lipoprotein GldD [Bacteroidota bacterium]
MRFSHSFILIILLISSCNDSYTPKPRGYFRIDLPVSEYRLFDTTFPYSFEYPSYAGIYPDLSKIAEPYWINIRFPKFKATLHISYKPVNGNLAGYINDAHTLVNKHIPKAIAIIQREYIDKEKHVYGLEYDIQGANAASPYQFYLTDSSSKFVRGALYFDIVPNNDSLAPVIAFLKADIQRLISSFYWKQPGNNQNHKTKQP